MSIKSTGDSSIPPIKTILTNPADGEALTYDSASGAFVNGIPFTTVKPVLTSPSNVSPLNSLTNYTFQTNTAFAVSPPNYLLTHYATDWQIASDNAFTNILTSTTLDTGNKTSWTAQFVGGYSPIYVRLRFHNGQEYSAWSDTVQYSVIQIFSFQSSTTHTIPNNTNTMEINLMGAGAGSSGNVSHGGGGGGYQASVGTAVTAGQVAVVTVGAGSTGSNAAGSSSFGNYLTANGGASDGTSGNGYARGAVGNGQPVGGGGAGGAGGSGSGHGGAQQNGGGGGQGVSHAIDGIARGGGGGGAIGASGNRHYGNNGGGGGHGGGGAGFSGGRESWQGSGSPGTNGYGGGAGSSHGPYDTTGGNGIVVIKYSA